MEGKRGERQCFGHVNVCLKFPHMTEIRSPETCSRPSPSSSQTHVCAADDQQEKRKRSHMAFGSPQNVIHVSDGGEGGGLLDANATQRLGLLWPSPRLQLRR